MSPEEREIVDAASPRVQAILLGTHESGPSLAPPAKPARATRSDKGKKKGPKVEAAEPVAQGFITKEQRAEFEALGTQGFALWKAAEDAIAAHEAHQAKAKLFLDSLTK